MCCVLYWTFVLFFFFFLHHNHSVYFTIVSLCGYKIIDSCNLRPFSDAVHMCEWEELSAHSMRGMCALCAYHTKKN